MDKLFDSSWFLRFTALFLALLLFFTVQAEENKAKRNAGGEDLDVVRNVPVNVFYDNENLVVTGVPETVDVTIEGPINIVQSTTLLKDFSVYVDLSSLPMGEHQIRIQHENLSEKLDVRIDPAVIDVVIEEKITKTFKIEPEFNKQLLAEDFFITSMEVDPSTIEVTGAKSVVESISFVKATVSSDPGVKESFEQEARVRVLDRDLNKLDLSIEPERVKVKVNVQENSKEVPIVLKAKGTPAADVKINELTPSESKITLSGPNRVLDAITVFEVDVDVSKVTKSGVVNLELKKPNDVSKISLSHLDVSIDATVDKSKEPEETEENEKDSKDDDLVKADPDEPEIEEPVSKETFQLKDLQVEVAGLDQQFKSTIISPTEGMVTLTLTGEESIIGKLEKSDFEVSVDASNISAEGEQTYPIIVKGPRDVDWTLSEKELTLKIEFA